MGYETKLIIGTLTNMKSFTYTDCNWVNKIAEINLCKCCFHGTQIEPNVESTKVYFFHGNEEIIEDSYGCQLYAINPKDVLAIMVKANKEENYRRYNAAIALLKSLIKDFKNENLTCILYGY